ncbi:MAG: NAD-dependent epimerase/dehydratase family protein [Lachnospiraceae bacterium]|nr:NAD-dependent epimerase/dehydratase family protein [Lachnospiraceae bacterium]
MSKILITGISGFIGSNLAGKFLSLDHEIIGWDISPVNIDNVKYTYLNMLDYQAVFMSLGKSKPDIIIHCAGSADVNSSILNPHHDLALNVGITHNLLFAVHSLRMTDVRIVFLSSAGVYGNPNELPINEKEILKPLSPYALHKMMSEEICLYFRQNYSIDIKIARLFSAYGRGLKKQIFWDMYTKAQATRKLNMFGTGSESRDYIHIKDITEAVCLISFFAAEHDYLFNIANGEEISILKAAECFAHHMQLANTDISFSGEVREGDPLNWCADITKISALGYKKSISFDKGISDYIKWLNENKEEVIL